MNERITCKNILLLLSKSRALAIMQKQRNNHPAVLSDNRKLCLFSVWPSLIIHVNLAERQSRGKIYIIARQRRRLDTSGIKNSALLTMSDCQRDSSQNGTKKDAIFHHSRKAYIVATLCHSYTYASLLSVSCIIFTNFQESIEFWKILRF